MPILSMPEPGSGGTYTADDVIHEELPDGRLIQVAARAGQTIPRHEAIRLGLVKAPPEPPTAESQAAEPVAPKVHVGKLPVNKGGSVAPYGAERAPAAEPAGELPPAPPAPKKDADK